MPTLTPFIWLWSGVTLLTQYVSTLFPNTESNDVRYIDIILRFPQIKCYSQSNHFINTLHITLYSGMLWPSAFPAQAWNKSCLFVIWFFCFGLHVSAWKGRRTFFLRKLTIVYPMHSLASKKNSFNILMLFSGQLFLFGPMYMHCPRNQLIMALLM